MKSKSGVSKLHSSKLQNPSLGKIYSNLGIGLMIALVIILLIQLFTLIIMIWYPTLLLKILGASMVFTPYSAMLFLGSTIISILLITWGIIIASILIKQNKYTPQLKYFIWTYVVLKAISSILYIFAKQYLFGDFILAILVWFFLLYHNNIWSRMILGKPLIEL